MELESREPTINTAPQLSRHLVLATVITRDNGSGLGLGPEPNHCNGLYHTKTQAVAIGPVSRQKTRHFNITTLAPIEYLNSDCIMT